MSLPFGFGDKILRAFLIFSMRAAWSLLSHSDFDHLNNFWQGVQITVSLNM
jgi:hypothetical protein